MGDEVSTLGEGCGPRRSAADSGGGSEWPYHGPMDHLVALVPSLGVGFLFFLAIRAMVHADRRERTAVRRLEEADENRTDVPPSVRDNERPTN